MAALKDLIAADPNLGPAATPAPPIQYVLDKLVDSKARGMTRGMTAAKERLDEFDSTMEAMLTGVALDPISRAAADDMLDTYWNENRSTYLNAANNTFVGNYGRRDVIIGSGFHAAVYAATRVLSGKPRPLVLERSPRAGGTFAMADRPVFYLNSRNRPGAPGLAGDNQSNLNYLPGAPIQAANMSTSEYQTNADMAFAIRLTLAQYADVIVATPVTSVSLSNGIDFIGLKVVSSFDTVPARHVIDARGIGDPTSQSQANGRTVMTFEQFMARMAQPWPLRGLRRIAVIGDGDAARCAIESALGLGPEPFMAAASLDFVERIDVYGPRLPNTCEEWESDERGRYKRIGRYLRKDRYGARRLNIYRIRGNPLAVPGRALVLGRSYDLAVLATGHSAVTIPGLPEGIPYSIGGVEVARRDGRVYRVGPHADLPFSSQEFDSGVAALDNNKVAMFRLADKTAALAATLGT